MIPACIKRVKRTKKKLRESGPARQSRNRMSRSAWSAWSLLPALGAVGGPKAPASWTHSIRFARFASRAAEPVRTPIERAVAFPWLWRLISCYNPWDFALAHNLVPIGVSVKLIHYVRRTGSRCGLDVARQARRQWRLCTVG